MCMSVVSLGCLAGRFRGSRRRHRPDAAHGGCPPKFKALAHAPPEESEATHRAITLAELAGVPS